MIHKTANAFSRQISAFFDERMKPFGVATSYVELILLVREHEEHATQKFLGEKLDLAASTITRFVAKLEKQGLVEKSRDGREISILLTPKGKALSGEMVTAYRSAEVELKEILGESFVETTGKLLDHGNTELQKSAQND